MHALVDKGPEGPLASLYVHVPFCTDRCTYCAFATQPDEPQLHRALVEALLWELGRATPPRDPLTTVYVGGGTPGLLAPRHLAVLLDGVCAWSGVAPSAEITLEVNPTNVTPQHLQAWHELGITRLSVGVQSFDDGALRRLARRHDGDAARRALETLADRWDGSWSADLLFGWGGQALPQVAADLEELLRFRPPHLSVYGLTVEPRTPLASMAARDPTVLAPAEEDAERDALWVATLQAAGLERYEVSNFATPGHQSRHNLAYWENREFLGLGPGASSSCGPLRWSNTPSTRLFLSHASRGLSPRQRSERLTPAQRLLETMVAGLRTSQGISKDSLTARFGAAWEVSLDPSIRSAVQSGYITDISGGLTIPQKHLSLADAITDLLTADIPG